MTTSFTYFNRLRPKNSNNQGYGIAIKTNIFIKLLKNSKNCFKIVRETYNNIIFLLQSF